MTENPFVTNGYSGPEYFCDRVEETKTLNKKNIMKQILLFYVLCCIGNLIFHLASAYFSSDLHDLKFGFPIMLLFVCLLYSPLCTFLAYIYKISKVNKQIIKHPLLFSLSPFIITSIIMSMLDIGVVLRDFLLLILFITENVFIISWFLYRYYMKQKIQLRG